MDPIAIQSRRQSARSHKRRVLFVAEAVTLAHVARPIALLQYLNPDEYDAHLACDPRYDALLPQLQVNRRSIFSISTQRFLNALTKGTPIYDVPTICSYVEEDLQLIEDTAPDVVVGDFRLSLAVSAPLTGTPYVTITNAYWSPYLRLRYPVPDLPIVRLWGVRTSQVLFNAFRRAAFAYHALPLNRVRRKYGLPRLGWDIREVYTYADCTLYADIPDLFPTEELPSNHRFLGPVLWSPTIQLPDWWEKLPANKPIVYVNLGSSGPSELLPMVLDALRDLPVTVIAATAGAECPSPLPDNAFICQYLPGDKAAEHAAVVICNGGSPATQQALAAGVPVLGIAGNMDQLLNMQAVSRAGAGELLRAGDATPETVPTAVRLLLNDRRYAAVAEHLSTNIRDDNVSDRLQSSLQHVVPSP